MNPVRRFVASPHRASLWRAVQFAGLVALFQAAVLAGPARGAASCPTELPESPARRRALAGTWFKMGEQASEASDLVLATKAFSCSLRISPHAFTAYNLAHVAESIGDLDLALESYEMLLRLAPAGSKDHDDAEAALARLAEERKRVHERLDTTAEAPPVLPLPSLSPPAPLLAPNPPAPLTHVQAPVPAAPLRRPEAISSPMSADLRAVAPPPKADGARTHRLRLVGWATMGVGAAALTTALVLNVQARREVNTCNDLWDEQSWDGARDECHRAQRLATSSYVGFGIGAAGLVTGAALVLMTSESARFRTFSTFAYLPSTGGGTLSWRRRF